MRNFLPLALVVVAAQGVRASPSYPTAIVEHLGIVYSPPCSLCHVAGKTGPGTAERPFAQSARARGLEGGDILLVGIALDALARDATDSDGDGLSDIQELLAGTDPNFKGAQSIEVRQDPTTGCASAGGGMGWLSLLGLIARPRRWHRDGRCRCHRGARP
jgi:Bacterial TSP3 repeat